MKKTRADKVDIKISNSLSREEQCSVRGGNGGGLLALPFIQQAMQGAAPGQESLGLASVGGGTPPWP
jgi:hypothetical protein